MIAKTLIYNEPNDFFLNFLNASYQNNVDSRELMGDSSIKPYFYFYLWIETLSLLSLLS